jgi:hypothetical protein
VRLRSPLKSEVHRSALARGVAGAAICACAFAVVALLVPVVSRWLDGPKRPATPSASASIPDDTGPALGPNVVRTEHKARKHAKPKPKPTPKHAVLVGGNVVILSGTDAAPAPAAAATPDPAPAPATRPVTKPKSPKKAPKVVADESGPIAAPVATPAASGPAASTGLVRLSVQSVGIGPNANGDPELQAKLAIQGAQASDALPPTVTLHLRPTIPPALQSNDGLAMKASVDMVNAERTTASDPALQMRVRMTINAAQASAAAAVPTAEEPAPPDAKSNVIALTAPLKAFVRAPEGGTPGEGGPTTPPTDQGPGNGDPTTPPTDQPTPGDPTTPPTDQGPGTGDPTTPPTDQPAPGDPTTPGDPTGGDPTTPPTTPPPTTTPGDPTTPGQPPAGDPTAIPPTEILIPVGPVRPNEGTTSVPVPTDPTSGTPTTDQVPVVVIVEELPPEEPPADPTDQSTPVVQDPAPEVVTPPADGADPGAAPAPDNPGSGSATAIVVSTDAPPPAANNS